MILYRNSSALVKRYVRETGSDDVEQLIAQADLGTSLITRADAAAWDYGLRGYDAVHLASALY